MNKYKVISLFSGCGGSDLGTLGGFTYLKKKYKRLSTEIVHASDIDAKAVGTYNKNLSLFKHKASVADIRTLSFERNMSDIVIGGFPCQNFSSVNPRKAPHQRENQLFWELARVVEEVQPKVFVGENVKGFFRLHGGKYFEMAKSEFERLGYNVSFSLVNVSEFGIPQLRERLILVGIKKDLNKVFVFPSPTHSQIPSGKLKSLVPLEAVIESLLPSDDKYYFSRRAVQGVKNAKPNMKRALAQNLKKPCLTITSHLAKVSLNSRDPVLLVDSQKEIYRRFTPREAARIQSFPDNFIFEGSESSAYRQIGNAIPPVYFWHLMNKIINDLSS